MSTATSLYGSTPLTPTGTERVTGDRASDGVTGGMLTQQIADLSGAPAVAVEFASDADLTLTQSQYQAESITFTDSPTTLTAARSVVFPAHFPTKWVKNNTAQTLTLKKSGQTGVTLAAGSYAIIASGYSDVVAGPGAAQAKQFDGLALSDLATALTTSTNAGAWFVPCNCTLNDVTTALTAAQSSSGAVTVDAKRSGTSIFSTLPSIAASTSTNGTAAVLSTTSFSKGDLVIFSITAAGTGAKGLQTRITFTPT